MLLLVDNYDSFTYNLAEYFFCLGQEVEVIRNDESLTKLCNSDKYDGVILSPGPQVPKDANHLMAVIDYYVKAQKPIFGVCLGMQAIAEYFGGSLRKANEPIHGKVRTIESLDKDVFEGQPQYIDVVRYHSWVIDRNGENLKFSAVSLENEPMGLYHTVLPISAVQFHPESILTENGFSLLNKWLNNSKLNKDY